MQLNVILNLCKNMEKEIVYSLLRTLSTIGMDKPSNFDDIVEFIHNDIKETADKEKWNDCDVVIGLRRFLEQIN